MTAASGAALDRAAALVRHNTILLLREPGPLLSRTVLPLAFVALMRPLYVAAQGPAAGTTQAVCGILVIFSLHALGLVGEPFLSERVRGTWNRLRASPARPWELLVGKAAPLAGALLVQQAVVLLFGVLVLGMAADGPLLALAALCWAWALLGLGAALGVLARSFGELSACYDIGAVVLSGLGGALVPLAALPGWVGVIAPVSPGYWGLGALRAAAAGDGGGAARACAVLLAVGLAGVLVVCTRVVRESARAATR